MAIAQEFGRDSSEARLAESHPMHPYYPIDLVLPEYVPNESGLATISSIFSMMLGCVLSVAWALATRFRRGISTGDKLGLLWFVLCGSLHIFFEGYFVLDHATFSSKQNLFAQLWKEYAQSDSRYLSGDLLVLCTEGITLITWGPLSYLTAIGIANSSSWRHPLQMVVSLGHFYGTTLYLTSSFVELYWQNISYSRPEPYYLWFYFFSMNATWLVVPGILLYQSFRATVEAFTASKEVSKIYQDRGNPKVKGRTKQS